MKNIFFFLLLTSKLFYCQNFNFDNTFGNEGKLTIMSDNQNYQINEITMRNDGKFIFSMTDLSDEKSVLKLMNIDGSFDNTFGESGIKKYNINYPIYLQYFSNGQAIGIHSNANQENTIIKFNEDYSIDTNFNQIISKGIFFKIQNDNKIVVSYFALTTDNYMRRYNSNGIIDNSFGNSGTARFYESNGNQINFSGPSFSNTLDKSTYFTSSRRSSSTQGAYVIRKIEENGNLTSYEHIEGFSSSPPYFGATSINSIKYNNNEVYVVPNLTNNSNNSGNSIRITKLNSNLGLIKNYYNSGTYPYSYNYHDFFYSNNNNPILLKSNNSYPLFSLINLDDNEILFEYNFNYYYFGTPSKTVSFQNNITNSIYIFNQYNDRIIISRLKKNQTLSLDETSKINFKLYPNPVIDILNFSEKLNRIEIFSIDGKIIKEAPSGDYINLENLSTGNYILKGYNKNKVLVQTKFTKK